MESKETWRLKTPKQCKTCPWLKHTTCEDIPNYDPELHKGLITNINSGLDSIGNNSVMACHYSTDRNQRHCIGWVHNQLGSGNNLGLRIKMMSCENSDKIEIIGEQVEAFEETFK